jgi:hypothetical protein
VLSESDDANQHIGERRESLKDLILDLLLDPIPERDLSAGDCTSFLLVKTGTKNR